MPSMGTTPHAGVVLRDIHIRCYVPTVVFVVFDHRGESLALDRRVQRNLRDPSMNWLVLVLNVYVRMGIERACQPVSSGSTGTENKHDGCIAEPRADLPPQVNQSADSLHHRSGKVRIKVLFRASTRARRFSSAIARQSCTSTSDGHSIRSGVGSRIPSPLR